MSAGLNRGMLDAGEYTTFEQPSDHQFIETVLHDCYDNGDNPEADIYWEVLLEFNYGPHYTSHPSFSVSINKIARTPKRGHDAQGSFKTNLIHSKGGGISAIRSRGHKRIDQYDYLPEAARDALHTAIDDFEPRHYKLPGDCRAGHVVPAGDESDWETNPFISFTDDGPRLQMWDTDSDGIAIHTSVHNLGIDNMTGIYIQGNGTPLTPVEHVTINGDDWDRPAVAGTAVEFFRNASVEISGTTAHIMTQD